MKTKSRIISVLCVAAMLLSFAGCGDSKKTDGGTADADSAEKVSLSTAEDAVSKVPDDLKDTTIKYYTWYDLDQDGEQAVIDTFTQKTGIKVDVIKGNYGDDYYTKLNQMVAQGEAPDVFRLEYNTPYTLNTSAQSLYTTGNDFSGEEWDQTTLSDFTFNGTPYAVSVKNTTFTSGLACYYNTKLFTDNGIEDPYDLWKAGSWNWAKFEETAKNFKSKVSGAKFGATVCPLSAIALAKGQNIMTFDGNEYQSNVTGADFVSAWRTACKYFEDGTVSKDVYSVESFTNGEIGMSIQSIASVSKKDTTLSKIALRGNLGVVPLPSDDSGTVYSPLMEYQAFAVGKGAANPKAVPYFLRYLLDSSNYDYDHYFVSDKAKEVFEYIRSDAKRIPYNSNFLTASDEKTMGDFEFEMKQCPSAQVESTLATFDYIIKNAAKNLNDIVSQMK